MFTLKRFARDRIYSYESTKSRAMYVVSAVFVFCYAMPALGLT
ncbi:hypothetical protein ACQEVG_01760 [Streptomyces sp. CA-135486]